jgi:hypothetical protein
VVDYVFKYKCMELVTHVYMYLMVIYVPIYVYNVYVGIYFSDKKSLL